MQKRLSSFLQNNIKNPTKQNKISRKKFIRKLMPFRAPGFKTTKKAHCRFSETFLKKHLLLHIISLEAKSYVTFFC